MTNAITVQELCDRLIAFCHEGHASAEVKIIIDNRIINITDVGLCGKDFEIAILKGD